MFILYIFVIKIFYKKVIMFLTHIKTNKKHNVKDNNESKTTFTKQKTAQNENAFVCNSFFCYMAFRSTQRKFEEERIRGLKI